MHQTSSLEEWGTRRGILESITFGLRVMRNILGITLGRICNKKITSVT